MTKEKLEAILIEVDMPRAVEAELREDEIKLSVIFANPKDPIKITSCYGKIIGNIATDIKSTLTSFAQNSRKLIEEQREAGLVPYYAIPRDPATFQELVEQANCTQVQ